MLRKIVSLVLVVLLFAAASANVAYADSNKGKEARLAVRVKEGVRKLGVGRDAQVTVKLRDKTKVKGYIGEAGEDSFVVIDAETGAANSVSYSSVKQMNGNNHSLGVRIAIGVVIAAAVVVALIILIELGFRQRDCDSKTFRDRC